MDKIKDLQKTLEKAKRIAIITHSNPDGDAFGSSCGLCSALRAIGKKVDVLIGERWHSEYDFLGVEEFITILSAEEIATLHEKDIYDLVILTDANQASRNVDFEKFIKACKNVFCIDHHQLHDTTINNSLNFIDAEYPSCCEYLFEILKLAGYPINKKTAAQ